MQTVSPHILLISFRSISYVARLSFSNLVESEEFQFQSQSKAHKMGTMTGSRMRRWPRMTSKVCVTIATISATITVLSMCVDVAHSIESLSPRRSLSIPSLSGMSLLKRFLSFGDPCRSQTIQRCLVISLRVMVRSHVGLQSGIYKPYEKEKLLCY